MKVVVLCGGMGTRLREETEYRPKPLVPVGNRPILWHILKAYAHHGFDDFLLALGYKGEMIKDYFLNYDLLTSDFALDLGSKQIRKLGGGDEESWRISFVDTGQQTMTGGRLLRLRKHLVEDDNEFMLTYGDGVSDVDIGRLVEFHRRSGCAATVTGVRPLARFGELMVESDRVVRFAEKPETGDAWINGGFFVMTRRVFDYLDGDESILEREPLERLAAEGELAVYRHDGYWHCMDTYRDMQHLNEVWSSGAAPWMTWARPLTGT